MEMIVLENPKTFLATLDEPGEYWLCCQSCDRFFQMKSAQRGDDVACPFDDCHDYGLGLGIYLWDAWRDAEDPRWPTSVDELSHGQRAPDPEDRFQERFANRVDKLLAGFEQSPEKQVLSAPLQFLRPFFKMMADCDWDVTASSECGFSADLAFVEELPVWSKTNSPPLAGRMAKELLAFFRFAARTEAVQDAEAWLAYLQSFDLAESFRYTMKHDKRCK